MKQLFLILFISVITNSYAQVAGEEYTVEEFGWTMIIPEGFENIGAKEWEKHQKRGLDFLGKHINEDISEAVEINETLFVVSSDTHNVLEVSKQPYDAAIDGDLIETNKEIAKLMANALEEESPGITVTTKFSTEEIGGKTFYKTTLVAKHSNGGQFVAYMYNRLFNKTEFCINIMYINPLKGVKMVKALKASTFK
jgi:hypothetical protein